MSFETAVAVYLFFTDLWEYISTNYWMLDNLVVPLFLVFLIAFIINTGINRKFVKTQNRKLFWALAQYADLIRIRKVVDANSKIEEFMGIMTDTHGDPQTSETGKSFQPFYKEIENWQASIIAGTIPNLPNSEAAKDWAREKRAPFLIDPLSKLKRLLYSS